MITYKTATTTKELLQILQLQEANLPSSISSEEKQEEGFVTVHHNFEILKRMNDACPHIIAKDGTNVIGYALSMHPKFGNEIEVLKPMFAEINDQFSFSETYIVMGQICIDKAYRRQGIFRMLYQKMQQFIAPEFSNIITEVDAANTRSLEAHFAIGFQVLSKYRSDERDWVLIYLK